MIVYVFFVHKKSVSKRKVCTIFIKKIKTLKKTKKNICIGFFRWVFLGGFFIANPGSRCALTRRSTPGAAPSRWASPAATPARLTFPFRPAPQSCAKEPGLCPAIPSSRQRGGPAIVISHADDL